MVKRRSDQSSVRSEMSMRRNRDDRSTGRGYDGDRQYENNDTRSDYDYEDEDVDERSHGAGYRSEDNYDDNDYYNDEDSVHD